MACVQIILKLEVNNRNHYHLCRLPYNLKYPYVSCCNIPGHTTVAVSNPRPVSLCYAARGRVSKLCVVLYYKKLHNNLLR
jgi:hypothetical protein